MIFQYFIDYKFIKNDELTKKNKGRASLLFIELNLVN
jgi:hypothetical protein